MQKDFLVQTSSLYAAICDEASPVNRVGFMAEALAEANRTAREQGREALERLFIFNDTLMSLARQGQLLPWTLLFDGVFRATVERRDAEPAMELDNLSDSTVFADLSCPSGRLVITCLSALGEARKPFIELPPGVYRVLLKRDEGQEFDHMLLDAPSAYPRGEGPDWHIVISPR